MPNRLASFDQLSKPNIFIIRMLVFLGVILVLLVPIYSELLAAFQANLFINTIIFAALLIGIIFSFRQVITLLPEIKWVNGIRLSDPGVELQSSPIMLAPMAALLRDRTGPMVLNTQTMRSILDSVAMRLDERRDLSRYMIGLMVFLGLLGTFYGLLGTVSAVGDTITGLGIGDGQIDEFISQLQEGLSAPLSGMGTAFSSSLFGLSGSLILGFLDLQGSGAQNRFFVELEDWLSTVTDITSDGGIHHEENTDTTKLLARLVRLNELSLQNTHSQSDKTAGSQPATQNQEKVNEGLIKLAEGLNEIVRVMRQDQRLMRSEIEKNSLIHQELLELMKQKNNTSQE